MSLVREWMQKAMEVAEHQAASQEERIEALKVENAALMVRLEQAHTALRAWARWFDTDSSEFARDSAYNETLKLIGPPPSQFTSEKP